MRDPFVFDSRSEFCKKPFGAVPCGSDVVFHVRPLTRDGYSRCVLVARREFSGEEIQMELLPEAVDGERTRFTGVLTAPSEPELLWYHFRLIRSDGSTALLDQSGWQETGEIQSWQLTVYEKTATPLWFGGGVVYQIFPDRFCRLSLPVLYCVMCFFHAVQSNLCGGYSHFFHDTNSLFVDMIPGCDDV